MSESFFELSKKDQQEALEYVRAETGRPTHLLEKDIWVVWALRTLFEAPIGADLTFKGGTSCLWLIRYNTQLCGSRKLK